MRVVVGSGNPIKLQATQAAFELVFPNISIQVIPCHAESGVSDQPLGDEETYQGAWNRVQAAKAALPDKPSKEVLCNNVNTPAPPNKHRPVVPSPRARPTD